MTNEALQDKIDAYREALGLLTEAIETLRYADRDGDLERTVIASLEQATFAETIWIGGRQANLESEIRILKSQMEEQA